MIGISFGLTRYFTGAWQNPVRPPEERIDNGETMRRYANELLALSTEYLNRSSFLRELPPTSEFRAWLDNDYRPRLRDYRRRLVATANDTPEISPLLQGADRLGAMVNRPADHKLRAEAAQDVIRAVSRTESAIEEMGVTRFLSEPARLPNIGGPGS